ncbi:hypothetical protein [Streptomyces sp. NPDC086777]
MTVHLPSLRIDPSLASGLHHLPAGRRALQVQPRRTLHTCAESTS